MELWLAFTAGVVLASIVTNVFIHVLWGHGTLQIDHSNPEKDVFRINVGDLDILSKKKHIILKVDNNANLSQN